ncbi:MAG TPA: lasso peptide biosynthesis B2 protein [Hyphomicrobiaceae bacterium]|nr:lasso peptide biosynthesis B2 protein [Hyphomicrobiaceae bacterium]
MQRLLWLEASLFLITACILVQCVPFRRWKWALGKMHPPAAEVHFRALGCLDYGAVGTVGRALETAARVLPGESVCLPQAIAAKWMLARRGYVVEVYFGSRRAGQIDELFELHAWAVIDELCITGATEVTTFTPIVRYCSDRRPYRE